MQKLSVTMHTISSRDRRYNQQKHETRDTQRHKRQPKHRTNNENEKDKSNDQQNEKSKHRAYAMQKDARDDQTLETSNSNDKKTQSIGKYKRDKRDEQISTDETEAWGRHDNQQEDKTSGDNDASDRTTGNKADQ